MPEIDLFTAHVSERVLSLYTRHLTDCNYLDWLNLIQHLPVEKHGQIFLTLNPPFEPDPKLVFREFVYDHPVLDANVNTHSLSLQSLELSTSLTTPCL